MAVWEEYMGASNISKQDLVSKAWPVTRSTMPSKTAAKVHDAPVKPTVADGSSTVPFNWPEEITYLTDITFTQAVTDEQKQALGRTTTDLELHAKLTPTQLSLISTNTAITTIANLAHPANGQRGLFAARHLAPDTLVCIYLGLVHQNSLSDTDPRSDYDLSLDREIGLSVDSSRMGNESRCANDYRGIAERPNAEFRDCFVKVPCAKRAGGTKWERRVGIFVLSAGKAGLRAKGIKEGEEILLSYGKGFWESRKVTNHDNANAA